MATWKKVLTESATEADLASNTPASAGEVLTATGTGDSVPEWAPAGSQGFGTLGDEFTIDTDSTVGKFVLARGADGTNHTVTLKASPTTADKTITLPDDTGTVALTGTDSVQGFRGGITAANFRANGTCPTSTDQDTWVEDTGTLLNGTYEDVTTTKIDGYGDNNLTVNVVVSDDNGSGTFQTISCSNDNGNIYQIGDRIKITGLLAAGCTGANDDGEFTVSALNFSSIALDSYANETHVVTLPDDGGTVMLNLVEDTTPELGGDLNLSGSNIVGNGDILLTPALEDIILLQATYNATGGKTLKINCTNDHVSGSGYLHLESDAGIRHSSEIGYTRSIVKNEDDMDSDSSHHLATQQSIKAYVDNSVHPLIDDDDFSEATATNVASAESIKAYADTMLPLTGGTLTGGLTMSGAVTALAHVANTGGAATFAISSSNSGAGTGEITIAADRIYGSAIKDEDNMVSDSDMHLASQQSIKAYVDSIATNHRYFTLTQQYYNCCSLDGRFYYRDTDSASSGNAIGFLKWSASDTEDPTALGDTVNFRAPYAKASGFGQVVPVDCVLLKVNISWGNSAAYETSQSLYTMTCTAPNDANADGNWDATTRDIWEVSGPGCNQSLHTDQTACEAATNHSGPGPQDEHWIEGTYDTVDSCAFQYDQDIPTTGGGGYTWNRELSAGDHVILGIYSNNIFLGSPSVTGAVTWWFKTR